MKEKCTNAKGHSPIFAREFIKTSPTKMTKRSVKVQNRMETHQFVFFWLHPFLKQRDTYLKPFLRTTWGMFQFQKMKCSNVFVSSCPPDSSCHNPLSFKYGISNYTYLENHENKPNVGIPTLDNLTHKLMMLLYFITIFIAILKS